MSSQKDTRQDKSLSLIVPSSKEEEKSSQKQYTFSCFRRNNTKANAVVRFLYYLGTN